MSRRPRGEAEVEQLIATGKFQHVTCGQANGEHLLERAARTVATAHEISPEDPDSAYVLAYDAARYAATALLAQQGLRPTTAGGHYVIELALRAQLGTDSAPSEPCADDATNSNTPPAPAKQPPPPKRLPQSPTPNTSWPQPNNCSRRSPSSDPTSPKNDSRNRQPNDA